MLYYKSYSEVLGARTLTYEFGGGMQNATYNIKANLSNTENIWS